MSRPPRDFYFLQMARLVSTRGTCVRRQVGCVLVNARGHVLATGYNGRAAGLPHCSEGHPCAAASAPSGTGLDACEALHAEMNALLQCRDPWAIEIAYVTASPCVTCTKLLLNTTCRAVIFSEKYPHADAMRMWEETGRKWRQA